MYTEQTKKLIAIGVVVALMFHIGVLYVIGSLGLSKHTKTNQKVLIPITMQLKPLNKATKQLTPVVHKSVSHIKVHPKMLSREVVQTGHNKFLASKENVNHGFSVPSGGNIKAGTVITHQGTSATSTTLANNIYIPPIPIFNPMPAIPSDMRTHRFKTSIRVEFFVHKDATFTLRLLSSTGYDELDRVVVRSLKQWRFTPATMNNKPVDGTLKLRIRFSVE